MTLYLGLLCHGDPVDNGIMSWSLNGVNAANTQRNRHVIITSKRRFDVIITCLLRCVFAGNHDDFLIFSHYGPFVTPSIIGGFSHVSYDFEMIWDTDDLRHHDAHVAPLQMSKSHLLIAIHYCYSLKEKCCLLNFVLIENNEIGTWY